MHITQLTHGFTITRDDGRWLVSHEDGSRWFEKIDSSGATVEDKACFYKRNADNRVLLEMHKDGNFRQCFYDEWDNTIAVWRPLSYNSGRYTGSVYKYEYAQQADGSVYGDRLDSKEYNDYWLWLSKVPDTFDVKEYVAKPPKKKSLFSYNPYDNGYNEVNIHQSRMLDGRVVNTYYPFSYRDSVARQSTITRGAIDEACATLRQLASRRTASWIPLDNPL